VLVEAAVPGREVECGVLEGENGRPMASVPAEIRLVGDHDWYDFEAKYLDDACEFDVPARLPADVTERVRDLACRAFVALDCAGLARVDFFLKRDSNELLINELNTMPGLTEVSGYPKMWGASGLSYTRMLDVLVELALERHREKSLNKTTRS
jgi:D-alanine-D-alanine ligase